jgi:hypothetical protein
MRSATTDCSLPRTSRATSLQAVNFRDGMIITADDLTSAVAYPLAMFQTLVRAFFGCGIVCGLEVKAEKLSDPKNYNVTISRGTAIDCHGFPLELCDKVRLNLAPDPCCDIVPNVCIAIRRVTSEGVPRRDCGCSGDCGCNGGHREEDCGCNGDHTRPRPSDSYQCTRIKDHVLIQAFPSDKLPENICMLGSKATNGGCHDERTEETSERPDYIECMTSCPDCNCCGDSWILIGCFELSKDGITSGNMSRRKYVKPIECARSVTTSQEDVPPPRAPGPPSPQVKEPGPPEKETPANGSPARKTQRRS